MSMNLIFVNYGKPKSGTVKSTEKFPFQTPTNLTHAVLELATAEEQIATLSEYIDKNFYDSKDTFQKQCKELEKWEEWQDDLEEDEFAEEDEFESYCDSLKRRIKEAFEEGYVLAMV